MDVALIVTELTRICSKNLMGFMGFMGFWRFRQLTNNQLKYLR